jgi:hypothetical protein
MHLPGRGKATIGRRARNARASGHDADVADDGVLDLLHVLALQEVDEVADDVPRVDGVAFRRSRAARSGWV